MDAAAAAASSWKQSSGVTPLPSRPMPSNSPHTLDVKGKARAVDEHKDAVAEQTAAPAAIVTAPAAKPLAAPSDRFDWRQTARQFRQYNLSDLAKLRRTPSSHVINSSNGRSEELKSRVAAYQERLAYLVGLERDDEVAAWERLRSRSLEDLVAEGWAMDGLVGYWHGGESSNKKKRASSIANAKPRMAILSRGGLQKLPWSRFKEGDQVELTPSESTGKAIADFLPKDDEGEAAIASVGGGRGKPSDEIEPPRVIASVISSDPYRMKLLLAPPSSHVDLESCSSWRIDVAFNDAIYSKIGAALDALAIDADGLEQKDVEKKWEISGSGLLPALLPNATLDARPSRCESIFAADARIKSWYERYSRSDPIVVEGDPDLSLNASQLKAVALMLSNRLSLIQGPPGTGKTHTLVSAIKLLKHHFAVPHPVLLSAHTNVAVDNLVEGALDAGLDVVRVCPANVVSKSERAEQCSLDRKMEAHPMWKKLEEVKIRIGNAKRRMAAIFEEASGRKVDAQGRPRIENGGTATPAKLPDEVRAELTRLRRSIGRLAQQSYMLNRQIQTHVLYSADVVCSTLISSTSAALRCIDFPLVFIDESTQALEHLSLMPLIKGARQVALIGDHKQLPPVLRSRAAQEQGGAVSLFERLVNTTAMGADAMQMLQVQHRMHPDLAAFPNAQFYAGQLESAERTHAIEPIKHSLDPSRRVVFIDHEGQEFVNRSTSEVSLVNTREVALLFHVLYDVLRCDPAQRGSSIGVVTPYLAQSRMISRLLRPVRDQDANHPIRRAIEKALGGARLAELEKVEVNTVDGFQGREKDVIIFSSVRCSTLRGQRRDGGSEAADSDEMAAIPSYNVGFLADERRLNVALTRAKKALFVLGNLETWQNGRGLTHGAGVNGADNAASPSLSSPTSSSTQDALALRNFAAHVVGSGSQSSSVVGEAELLASIDMGMRLEPVRRRSIATARKSDDAEAEAEGEKSAVRDEGNVSHADAPHTQGSLDFGRAFF